MRDGRWQYKVETFKQSVWSYKPKKVDSEINEKSAWHGGLGARRD